MKNTIKYGLVPITSGRGGFLNFYDVILQTFLSACRRCLGFVKKNKKSNTKITSEARERKNEV